MKLLKFGGSSIASAERIKNVIEIIKSSLKKDKELAVVFSAYHSVTDKLVAASHLAAEGNANYLDNLKELENRHLAIAKELISVSKQSSALANIKFQLNELDDILHGVFLIKELSLKTLDYILSFGERLSAYTISEILNDKKIANNFLDARSVIKTDAQFGNARVLFDLTNKNIQKYFAANKKLQIVTGYIASTIENETTTLGRGGSDFTASIIGAALNAKEIEIWTDVDGVLTANPQKVKNAFPIKHLTFNEAMELSHFGAKVIYPPTMQPAHAKGIPLRIKNTFNPSAEGTLISKKKIANDFLIKGISSIDAISLVLVEGSGMVGVAGIAERIFSALAKKQINVILITQASSEHSICLAIPPRDKKKAKEAIEFEFKLELIEKKISEVKVENDFAIIAIVGENMQKTPGIAGRVFQALGRNGINIAAIAQGSSELNISVVISKKDEAKALNALHEAFFLSKTKSLHLFLVGPGLIGKTFLTQLKNHQQKLAKEFSTSVHVCGIVNTKKMILRKEGISLDKWEKELTSSNEISNLQTFVTTLKEFNLRNSIFIDCTASEEVVNYYLDVLSSNISVVTPNKRANTKSFTFYKKLRETASKHNVKFLYETNVGASLPIIGTIKDLVTSGDSMTKIEGILSGTLSYIFNSFKAGKKFSSVVLEAREKGYTEPDPREDLNGKDVARKLLILARECGYQMELSDIKVENLIFPKAQKVKTVKEFFGVLKENDGAFEKLRLKEEKDGKVLRYIAKLEKGKAEVSLQAIDRTHPFFFMSGNDNILAVHTLNYVHSPLVIKGPGAGADVTAAGVFADVLRISNYLS
ncbi:MAG: bifunctional aspartate kinase/homoserine dehydrogenase I [Ignavibacteria bacterium CG1_02_37_35]|nr:bifunctional aspartate kinase/homoserine dehydrogenase I [Ignavibacteria bacterium]OIO21526.1 MAG: bifunctional aspartate kinase/homoserine dehydrogenase I [Ignavibacteria bacterium CG1_02_37_35]PIX93076.1 MAG: bifunctional aspartate kinase/homoserine dehydrogenase I [Ignavibacteria bacterium CG_4_10_14_3_um_filter_37_18]